MSPLVSLPIDPVIPRIQASLAASARLVLVAPPGAGKTTRVPPALLNAEWLGGRKIVMLEPRRLAARAAARRISSELGDTLGGTVGYRVHLDTVVSARTRIEVVTEGVLTRMLQEDPTLSDIGAVIFDEFHERSIHADLGLALSLHAQSLVRDDLRIIAMSATIAGAEAARVIDAPLIESEGRAFPVATEYRPRRERERVEAAVERVVLEALDDHAGDVLAFLPGGAEIRRVTESLSERVRDASVAVLPLHGELTGDAQDAAIAPSPPGRRKVVVATNIAETSLTIEGVRIVVDAGLARAPRFSPRTGLTRLETVRISRASADQRRGRAGRVAPGVCYRLWSEGDDAQLAPRNVPEILDADLAPLALELAVAGIEDVSTLTWLDAPPAGPLRQARGLLRALGALDDADRITGHGRALASAPAHPRIAHMLLRARELGRGAIACDIAALLNGRDFLRPAALGGRVDADLRHRLEVLSGGRAIDGARVDGDALRRVRQESRALRERLRVAGARIEPDDAGLVLALAYPDRIARKRAGQDGRFLLSSGTGAHFEEAQAIGGEEWLVIAETDGRAPESRIFLAAPVSYDALVETKIVVPEVTEEVRWDDRAERVVAARRTMVGAIVVREQPLRDVRDESIRSALIAEIRRRGIGTLAWNDGAQRTRERLAFLHRTDASWPDVSDAALSSRVSDWLEPSLGDARSLADVSRVNFSEALLSLLDWKQRAQLDELAPTHVEVPSGSRISVDYSNPDAPSLAVRLQEVFGLAATPKVSGVPLTLELLSPAHRPVQVTKDLAAFWRGSYAEVRKEMRGRYPKHDWPEDPSVATPHRGRRKL